MCLSSVPGACTEGAKPESAASLATYVVWKSCVKWHQDFPAVLEVRWVVAVSVQFYAYSLLSPALKHRESELR